MSKINVLRIINLNYNNNTIRIDDECFHLGTESTLFSLRNGGGKSVLVQMLTAPFVHKRYRNTKDRPFESYFTTSRPTHILVEWQLDGGAGYVLIGMMVRKKQDQSEDGSVDELEILTYIHEYRKSDPYDIHHIPLVENVDGQKKLKSYVEVKKLLEDFKKYKKDKASTFNYYDLNQPAQYRRYFEHLKEYKIDHKEWETIIKKINEEESGLSKLFANAKDEKGLIENWFLPTIESKLAKEDDRTKKFAQLMVKYIEQYKASKSKIERKDAIDHFKEATIPLRGAAENFEAEVLKVKEHENSIAHLIQYLVETSSKSQLKQEEVQGFIEEIEEDIRSIAYDALSYDIYTLEDQKQAQVQKRIALEHQLNDEENQRKSVIKAKNIQSCAYLHKKYMEASKEVQEWENDLDITRQKDKDLTPERDNLGYNLKCYYDQAVLDKKEILIQLENRIEALKEERSQEKQREKSIHSEQNSYSQQKGNLKAKIEQFDQMENSFNGIYKESLTRNIMGTYEEGLLESKQYEVKQAYEKIGRNIIQFKNTKQNNEEKLISITRNREDAEKQFTIEEQSLKQLVDQFTAYKEELEARKIAMRYIDLPESMVFDLEKIEEAFKQKLSRLQQERRNLESQLEKEEEAYQKLKTGKVLDLPKEVEMQLSKDDLDYVYGMEWLRRNRKSTKENEALVAANPFIPYAIIMSEKDLLKLQNKTLDLYTSFPIPIIKREDLEGHTQRENAKVYQLEKVSFIVAFNHNLLDETGLKLLLEEKEQHISQLQDKYQSKQKDIAFYDEKRNLIAYQKVTKVNYEEVQKQIQHTKASIDGLNQEILDLRQAYANLEKEQTELQSQLSSLEENFKILEKQLNDLSQLILAYGLYMKQKEQLSALEEEIKANEEMLQNISKHIAELEEGTQKANKDRLNHQQDLEALQEKQTKFRNYHQGEYLSKDIEDMEARYNSITKELQGEQQLLEKNLEKAQGRFKEAEEELMRKQTEYKLSELDYKGIKYDRFIEDDLKRQLEALEAIIKELRENWHKVETQIRVIETEMNNKIKDLPEKVRESVPKDRSLIKVQDFKVAKRAKEEEKTTYKQQFKELEKQSLLYEANLGYLKEYEHLTIYEQAEEGSFYVPVEEISDLRAKLIRDYKEKKENCSQKQKEVEKLLRNIMAQEQFKEDFFKVPLENLEELTAVPDTFLEQLQMIYASYEELMGKIAVDIALIEEEKEKVIDVLLQYIADVHAYMGKIDKNATITIRGRSLKMLKIILPNWEEQLALYTQRLKDFVELLTERGLKNLERNENIEELVGTQVTTKNLYNDVVGIGNIDIKLYKIEEDREYPITWADVSKNSGGEGFLSAFVILSSLLSFMRRDDTDIFAEYEDGKVLVMDNPFAQTNAEHLLKPLMDIAKKSNTQLICLTGLGGESIYNRFDNIYVLSLITSRLQNGTKYLRSEHKKGENTEELVATHMKIEEVEQTQLF